MAVYFQLTRIGSREPSAFQDIDRAICHNLELPFDDVRYAADWYDLIGFRCALGKSFQDTTDYINSRINDTGLDMAWRNDYRTLLRINHFLLENYSTDSWFGR